MRRVPNNRIVAFLLLAAAGLTLDLGSKHWMFTWAALQPTGQVWWVWPGFFGFQNSLNEGALFGMGQGLQYVFALFSIAAAVGIPVWLFVYGAGRDWWLTIPLGGIMAGVLGNLYDRLSLHGMVWGVDWPLYAGHQQGEPIHAVRDWVLFQLSDAWRWPNFNLADAFLVVGAAVIFLRASFAPNSETGTNKRQETPSMEESTPS